LRSLRRMGKRTLIVLVVAVALFGLLCAFLACMDWAAKREVQTLLAALKTEKATLEDLIAPPIPDEENGAVLFEQARQLLEAGSPDADLRLAAVSVKEAEVRAYLEKNRDALDRLRQALEKPKCRFDVQYSQTGLGKMLTTLAVMRELTRLLAWDALYARHRGDLSGAVGTCRALWRIRPCAPEGGIICLLVGHALDYQASNVTRQIIDQVELPQGLCESLVAELQSKQIPHARLVLGVKVERALSERLRDDLWIADIFLSEWPVLARVPALGGVLAAVSIPFARLDHAAHLRILGHYLEAIEAPWPQRLDAFDFDAEVRSLPFFRRRIRGSSGVLERLAETEAEHTACVDVSLLAMALKLSKAKRGDYPNRLSELAPECLAKLPTDPFTGDPYRYTRKRDGFVVYSVGKNRVDDGGVEDLKNPQKSDIAFEVTK